MSLNKQMHERNPYKSNPPDFKQLAIEFEEFRKFCTLGPNGKVTINFQDDDAVRCLSRVLLKRDFNLNVDLPKGSLVPRIPQKINYVLHIDDLIKKNDLESNDKGPIYGIDIGTGASCIYALLGSRLCDWNMLATDADQFAVQVATANVLKNQLANKIRIAHVDASQKAILLDVVKHHEDIKFTFCMCNPPFFESHETSKRFKEQESGVFCNKLMDYDEKRPAPKSATIARSNELQVEGGELAFVNRIIDDSIILQDKILIYTSMLGKKQSVVPLKKRLERLMGVRFAVSTLNQGKTQRWVLAWTFRHDVIVDIEANPTTHSLSTAGMMDPRAWVIDQLARLNMKKSEQHDTVRDFFILLMIIIEIFELTFRS
ncbi:hypothetical protein WR25_21882 isoform C [Diploscapter pachys]|uniref:U6 small nuclear RNA (adenine-(43)-N(6))-methyltransferase n=1 Tax=Diploscapter pachys TaxID=2018661 RepID=A0A2A2LKU0_9BILA|nr:hypothetical protein WR25_21882 isoform A [Diploscapter pachys]PAV86679.1 hypothetical protein WR25_21882 isoform B [Diploscapter pachys]PAV86680.1 hypothetical protein WR25_21882 isoform C [Diploscapter pachys]